MLKRLKQFIRKRLSRRSLLLSHKFRAIAANIRYGFPARGMLVIGVTGTKGKSSTSYFITSILEEAGYTVGMISTVSIKIADKVIANDTNKSVLPPMQLQKIIREMKEAHCTALVMETTSIGIDQFRVWGLPYRLVGLTNITHDHLDYHETWANYQAAKLKLFTLPGLVAAVVNADDPSGPLFLEKTTAKRKWSYSLQSSQPLQGADEHVYVEKLFGNSTGSVFTLVHDEERAKVKLELPGHFSVENALCATALCLNLNLKLGTIVSGLEKVTAIPGRLEKIESKRGFSLMVDYAHTPDSLEKLYATLRPDVRGRMIAVLGATGDRDKTKRPIMGALAARFCDYVFITDEEPYSEDPLQIIEEVARGVPRGRPLFQAHRPPRIARQESRPILKKPNESGEGEWWWKVTDRREAISRAIELCKLDDLVLVTGMGSLNFKTVGDESIPWNDRQVIEELLAEKNLL